MSFPAHSLPCDGMTPIIHPHVWTQSDRARFVYFTPRNIADFQKEFYVSSTAGIYAEVVQEKIVVKDGPLFVKIKLTPRSGGTFVMTTSTQDLKIYTLYHFVKLQFLILLQLMRYCILTATDSSCCDAVCGTLYDDVWFREIEGLLMIPTDTARVLEILMARRTVYSAQVMEASARFPDVQTATADCAALGEGEARLQSWKHFFKVEGFAPWLLLEVCEDHELLSVLSPSQTTDLLAPSALNVVAACIPTLVRMKERMDSTKSTAKDTTCKTNSDDDDTWMSPDMMMRAHLVSMDFVTLADGTFLVNMDDPKFVFKYCRLKLQRLQYLAYRIHVRRHFRLWGTHRHVRSRNVSLVFRLHQTR